MHALGITFACHTTNSKIKEQNNDNNENDFV